MGERVPWPGEARGVDGVVGKPPVKRLWRLPEKVPKRSVFGRVAEGQFSEPEQTTAGMGVNSCL